VKRVRVVNQSRGRLLGDEVDWADGFWTRLKGLIGRSELRPGQGLMIVPCHGVHMYGLTFPIDVALLDPSGEVVALYRELAPGARTRWHGEARMALELPAGILAESDTRPGDRLTWETEVLE